MNAHNNTPADPSCAPIEATAPAEDLSEKRETASEHSVAIVERKCLTIDDPGFFDLSRFTAEELHIAMERMRPALEQANREDAGLWVLQMAEAALDEDDLLVLESEDGHFTTTIVRGSRP